ncbi:glutaredoxin family protein [Stutzerimonas stutzeri]|nr:glutaredoxin family protein [Pseudomonas sp.]MCQ4225170.1 glutaredoxin family protein [Stutzerimonas stutzeri]QPT30518.1 glutaredoxin family protein [Stutzerimonas stutzeri]
MANHLGLARISTRMIARSPMLPECQLFGTLGCHLCEQAEEVLMPLVEHGLLVELMDIAERSDWVELYGLRIPVLRRVDNGAELDWPFEAEQVVSFLQAAAK